MRFWLEQPCSELSREYLLDEHRSMHSYIRGMIKSPQRWCCHSILGPMDHMVMYIRHEEEVAEMTARGYKHHTPVDLETIHKIKDNREKLGLVKLGQFLSGGKVVTSIKLKELQEEYQHKHNI